MIKEQFYNIHSLVRLHVRATETVCEDIDLHLASFRCDDLDGEADVILDRYDQAPATPKDTVVDDYEYGEGCYHRPAASIRYDFYGSPQTYYMNHLNLPINLIIQLALLKKGYTFIHGAGLCIDGKNILFPAYPGTGKTTTVAAFSKRGALLFGDDLCIIGHGQMYSFPQALSVYPHHLPVLEYSEPSIEKGFKRTEFIDRLLAPIAKTTNKPLRLIRIILNTLRTPSFNVMPNKVFGDEAIATNGKLDEVIVLERSGNISTLVQETADLDEISDQAATILWHEWHPWFHDLLLYDAMAEWGRATPKRFQQVSDIANDAFKPVPYSRVKIPATWDNTILVREFPIFLEKSPNTEHEKAVA